MSFVLCLIVRRRLRAHALHEDKQHEYDIEEAHANESLLQAAAAVCMTHAHMPTAVLMSMRPVAALAIRCMHCKYHVCMYVCMYVCMHVCMYV